MKNLFIGVLVGAAILYFFKEYKKGQNYNKANEMIDKFLDIFRGSGTKEIELPLPKEITDISKNSNTGINFEYVQDHKTIG